MELRPRKKPAATTHKLKSKQSHTIPWWSKGRLKFYKFEQLPDYLKDNEYIRTGYRAKYSYHESFISLFHLHNESGNVWTHLLGILVYLWIVYYTWNAPEMENMQVEDKVVVTVFLFLAIYTVLFSSLLHLNVCVSHSAQKFWSCLDHSGISASIAAGSISLMYLLLHCHGWMRIFWIGTLILFNSVGIIGPMFEFWGKPRFRVWRSLLYVGSGFTTLLPVIYYVYHEGLDKLPLNLDENYAIGWILLMALQYLVGAFFYASRIPECFFPGKFDFFFQSHQIW
jgi:adiponectin receptor